MKPTTNKNKIWFWVIGIIALIVAVVLYLKNRKKADNGTREVVVQQNGTKTAKRGVRNKNVGNIKIAANAWKGKIPVEKNTDGVFEQFETFEHGIRAMIITLMNYYKKYSLNTVEKIISRYCPPFDDQLNVSNPTDAYIDFVSKKLGVDKSEKLDMSTPQAIKPLVLAIALMESEYTILDSQYNEAVKMI